MKFYYIFIILLCFSCKKTSEIKDDLKKSNQFYDKAFEYLDKNKRDSAFYYFNLSKDDFLKNKDSLGIAKSLINMAIIQENAGDIFGSQETSVLALKYLKPIKQDNYYYLATNYNNLGIVNGKLKNYYQSLDFFEKAIIYTDDNVNKVIYQNNLANTFRRIKNFNKAISTYNKILSENINQKEYSRILSNLTYTKWLQKNDYNPVPELKKALNIRFKENDYWGQNASYSHLADYYSKNKKDSALFYAQKMYGISKKIESPDDQIEALQKLIILDPKNYFSYFNRYQFLTDSLQTVRNKAKNQFALIRYETEKNKADFLKAKAESTQKQNQIIKQYVIIAIIILFLLLLIISFRKRQKRLQQEKLLEVKNTELKYSKKVHDKVANRIYQLMSQVENRDVIDKPSLLFGLENAYEISRDISYDNREINENQYFSDQLKNMLDSYSSHDIVKMIITGNDEEIWQGISFHNKTEIFVVLQELMTNMKKHSKANIVSVRFSKEDLKLNILYTDNGIGMKGYLPKNGIQNMENRINAINGTIIFDTEINNLLKINISIPV